MTSPLLTRTEAVRRLQVAEPEIRALGIRRLAAGRRPGLVVITKDEDFVRLLERRGPPPHVVWVTCGNVSNLELRRIVIATWPRAAELLQAGEPLVEIQER